MEKVLIDSSIFIGIARKEPKAEQAMHSIRKSEVLFCDIVLAEVLAGSRNHEEYKRTASHILRAYRILPMTEEVCERFREILVSKPANDGVHISDFLIAATAIAHNIPLLTLNKRHFSRIKGLQLA